MHYYKERDADRKMAKILRMYEIANRLDPKMTKLRAKSKRFKEIKIFDSHAIMK